MPRRTASSPSGYVRRPARQTLPSAFGVTLLALGASVGTPAMAGAGEAGDPIQACLDAAPNRAAAAGCIEAAIAASETALKTRLDAAQQAAQSLDAATGRPLALPALIKNQADFLAYRDSSCLSLIDAAFAGGSGGGAASASCLVSFNTARADWLAARFP